MVISNSGKVWNTLKMSKICGFSYGLNMCHTNKALLTPLPTSEFLASFCKMFWIEGAQHLPGMEPCKDFKGSWRNAGSWAQSSVPDPQGELLGRSRNQNRHQVTQIRNAQELKPSSRQPQQGKLSTKKIASILCRCSDLNTAECKHLSNINMKM